MASSSSYSRYLAISIVAAVEAQRGERDKARQFLRDAQSQYRRGGWPRSIAQTAESLARFHQSRAALDIEGLRDLRRVIALVPDVGPSLLVLIKACDVLIQLHSAGSSGARVAVTQLRKLVRDSNPGRAFRALGNDIACEAILLLGDPAAAITFIEDADLRYPGEECGMPLLAAAQLALGNSAAALEASDGCTSPGTHHSPARHSLLLLVRAAAHELAGDPVAADASFVEATLSQRDAPMPYLFLMVPAWIRSVLWSRIDESSHREWGVLRRAVSVILDRVENFDDAMPRGRLTLRELEILEAMERGGSLEEIAALQFVSRNTVKTHVRHIYRKLNISTRAEAADLMARFGRHLLEGAER